LLVSKDGRNRRWAFRYTRRKTGKPTETGLGSAELVTLAEARDKAHDLRKAVARDEDPIEKRREERRKGITFADMASAFIAFKQSEWRSKKHCETMRLLLNTYARSLATKHIAEITPDDVAAAVRDTKQRDRTLRAVRQVFDLALGRELCVTNPADKRFMKHRLAGLPNDAGERHFESMPYSEIPQFVKRLRTEQQRNLALSPFALEFLILTASRAGEVVGMRWEEINWEQKTWTIPGYRTKALRQHRVPLVDQTLALLKQQALKQGHPGNGFVWTHRRGRPLTVKALYVYLNRYLGIATTVHGFRSSFRVWAAEETAFDFQLAEMCLAHVVRDRTVRAYLRADGLEKRRALMAAWSDFCCSR
jgi:integrase